MSDPLIGGGSSGGSRCAPIDSYYLLTSADSRLPDAVVFPGVLIAASTAPGDTRYLWSDTSTTPATLKYYNGTSWQPFASIGATGPMGPAGPGTWSPLTADFTAGAMGSSGLIAVVAQPAAFAVRAYVMLADITGAQALYRVTSSPSTTNPSAVTLTRVPGSHTVSATYVFAVANAALVTISGIAPCTSGHRCSEPVVVDVTGDPHLVFAAGDIVMNPA